MAYPSYYGYSTKDYPSQYACTINPTLAVRYDDMVSMHLGGNLYNAELSRRVNTLDEIQLSDILCEFIRGRSFPDVCHRIKKMNEMVLRNYLSDLRLNSKETIEVLQARMKNSCSSFYHEKEPHFFEFNVVVDFEATCEEVKPEGYMNEIIEFPAVMINLNAMNIHAEFHKYVKPVKNPKLSDFCKKLTGISQRDVAQAPTFPKVWGMFKSWLDHHNLTSQGIPCRPFAIATDSPNDMALFLRKQCNYSRVRFPKWAQRLINVKKCFSGYYGMYPQSLAKMLKTLDMKRDGRPHSGYYDAKNIANVVFQLVTDGCNLRINEKINRNPVKKSHLGESISTNVTREEFEKELSKRLRSAPHIRNRSICTSYFQ